MDGAHRACSTSATTRSTTSSAPASCRSPQLVGTPEHADLDLNALVDARGASWSVAWRRSATGTAQFSGSLRNVCTLADLKLRRLLGTIDQWAVEQGLDAELGEPERYEPTRVPPAPPLALDLAREGITTVVWATGFRRRLLLARRARPRPQGRAPPRRRCRHGGARAVPRSACPCCAAASPASSTAPRTTPATSRPTWPPTSTVGRCRRPEPRSVLLGETPFHDLSRCSYVGDVHQERLRDLARRRRSNPPHRSSVRERVLMPGSMETDRRTDMTQLDVPPTTAPTLDPTAFPPSNAHLIPPLAPQWQGLDLREILTRPAAFLSISQSNSLYREGGVQYAEGHAFRGSLEATIKVAKAARQAPNFVSFNWIGYTVFRDDYPQSDFDAAQYRSWTGHLDVTREQRAWDDALVDDLRELVQPQDNELYEKALQTAFTGTDLPITLARKKVEVLVLTGIHLDWCVEGNARAARDHGLLPIVIGDATGCQRPDQEAAAFERINSFFAPVISSDTFVDLLKG